MTRHWILYNMAIFILALVLLPFWLIGLLLIPKWRAGFFQKLGFLPRACLEQIQTLPLQKRIWIHTVSVGELNAAKPLIQMLIDQGYGVILSATTQTGYTLAHQLFPKLAIFYFPFDLPWVIQQTLQRLNPQLILILETEIWPNLLMSTASKGVPVVLINGRLSQKSFQGYYRFRWFFGPVLEHFSALLMQSKTDANRMIQLGAPASNVVSIGNIKFDLPALNNIEEQRALKNLFQLQEADQVVVFASSHPGEEEIFLEMFLALTAKLPHLKAVLAPRHPERTASVAQLLSSQHVPFCLRSQLSNQHPATESLIVLDTIGELNTVFALSDIACMGGTFVPWGGHNPLEPINAGIPVIFGPSMENFSAIASIVLQSSAGIQVDTPQAAQNSLFQLLTSPQDYKQMVLQGKQLMQNNRGVTQRILHTLKPYLTNDLTH